MSRKRKALVACSGIAVAVCLLALSENRSKPVRPSRVLPPAPQAEYVWKDGHASPNRYIQPLVREYLSHVPAGAEVLDLGCGNGAFTGSFHDTGWRLTGADISDSGLTYARQTWPGITFEKADATGDVTALGIGRYDAIISTDVIEHVLLPRQFARNCRRLLKPGGTLVLSTPYHGYAKNLAIALFNGFDGHFEALTDYGHVKFFSVDSIVALLHESGFEEMEWRGAGRLPYLWKSMIIRARASGSLGGSGHTASSREMSR